MDSEITRTLQSVPDAELLRRLAELVSQSHGVEADLVAHLGEVDERRLYARRAFPSMFAYCTEHLHLSEAEAYRRITVARAARKHPAILEPLRDGRIHLSGLARLVPLLTAANCEALLTRATHLTTRQIEAFDAATSELAGVRSLANSAAVLGWAPARRDWVRAGGLLYGLSVIPNKTGSDLGFEPAMTLSTRLI